MLVKIKYHLKVSSSVVLVTFHTLGSPVWIVATVLNGTEHCIIAGNSIGQL